MDFLQKLFPIKSLFQSDGNTLTAWWVLVIILLFFFYVIRLVNVTRKIRKKLENLSTDFSEDKIKEERLFSEVWQDYQESFIEFNGVKKTDEFSFDYFNEKNLLAATTNLRLINSIPATLVGLGILGTFVGLTYGISNFQTSSTEQIKVSIETLLSGMGTAFVSSIYGMLLSLAFTFFEKIQVNSLHNSLHTLCYKLDRKFKISKEDERNIGLNQQKALLSQYFVFQDDNGNEVKPGNVLRDIYQENIQQRVALQFFSTDLANLIEAGFERILNDPSKNELHTLIAQLKNSTDQMKVSTDQMKTALEVEIQKLSNNIQEPTTNLVKKITDDLVASFDQMIRELNESLNGTVREELERLAEMMRISADSLNGFPARAESMTTILDEKFRALQNKIEDITQRTTEQSEESSRRINDQVEKTAKSFGDRISDLQISNEMLLNQQKENTKASSELMDSFKSSMEQLNTLSGQINATVTGFGKIQGELNSVSGQFRAISENVLSSTNSFKEAQNRFTSHSENFINQNKVTIEEIQKALKKAENLSNDYASKFAIIENGLKDIFSELDKGLKGYEQNVKESTGAYLEKYASALTETAQSLERAASSSHSMQKEFLVELTEQIGNLNENLNNLNDNFGK